MPKKIVFNKYQKRQADYHWQQVSHNVFRFNAYVMARYRQVVKLIPRSRQLRILDVGCGDGVLLSLLSQGWLYGVDTDQDSLNFASGKIKAKLIQAKAERLPFSNNFFDLVIATEIIEHLDQPGRLLTEAKRVLRPGGRLIITTPVKVGGRLTDRLHVREFAPEELRSFCRNYFNRAEIVTSHPLWLKKIYIWSLGRLGRFHLDVGRWLVNLVVLISGWNPFIHLPGQPTQQLALCRK